MSVRLHACCLAALLIFTAAACGGGESSPPTDPSSTVPTGEASDPTTPVDSVDPTTPVDSVDPTTPVDSVDPTTPVDSVDPTTPVDSVDPTTPVDSGDPSGEVAEVTVWGGVVDAEGLALADVRILRGDEELAVSGPDGGFEFAMEVELGVVVGLTFLREGFVPDHKPVLIEEEADEVRLDVALLRRGAMQVMARAEDGGSFTGALGGRVTFPENAIADADGNLVEGPVAFTLTPVDFGAPAGPAGFPGSAAAVDASGESTMLESFGVMDVTFVDDGRGLRLADGVTASIEIPLTAGDLGPGDTTPLWSLDAETGLWREDGEGEVVRRGQRSFLVGEVGHFSWWNCDLGIEGLRLELEVLNPDETPFLENISVSLEFEFGEGIFQPSIPILRGRASHRLLFPVDREMVVRVQGAGSPGYGSRRTTVSANRTDPVQVVIDAGSLDPSSWVTIPADEPLVLPLEEGDSVYLTADPDADDARLISLRAEEGLTLSIMGYLNTPSGIARRVSSGNETILGVAPGDADSAPVWRVDALADGTLRAEDDQNALEPGEVERVTLGAGLTVERMVYLRAGQWVRLGASTVDTDTNTRASTSLTSGVTGDGAIRLDDVMMVGTTGFHTARFNGSGDEGEMDIVLRELDAPTPVPFSPGSVGTRVIMSPGLAGGQLFELPVAPGGAVEAWARADDPEHGVAMASRWVQRGENLGGSITVSNDGGSGTQFPRPRRGFVSTIPEVYEDNYALLVFVGPDERFSPDEQTIDAVLSTWSGEELEGAVVGDPAEAGCQPDALSVLAVSRVVAEGGTMTFCTGEHQLHHGELDRDDLVLEGAGMGETTLQLWRSSAIEDSRGGFRRAEAQHWTLRDLTIEGRNQRIGNEPRPLVEMEARNESSSLIVERVRFYDTRPDDLEEPGTFGGSGINFSERTDGVLVVEIRDSEFVNMNTAIRGFSALLAEIDNIAVRDSRHGVEASNVLELVVRDSHFQVEGSGLEHSGGKALRTEFESNLIQRSASLATAYCLSATTRDHEDVQISPEDPRSIVRDNTCILPEGGGGGIWLNVGGSGGALVEGNRILPDEESDFLGNSALRVSWSSPTGTITDNPGLIRVVNNVFLDQRNTSGVMLIGDAHLQGPVEIVNNTVRLAEGTGTGRSRALDLSYPGATEGPLDITVLNNLFIGAGDGRDDGVVLTNPDNPIISAGNVFANFRHSHGVRGTNDPIAGYGAANTSVPGIIQTDEDGRPDASAASVYAGVDREEVPETDIDGVARPQGDGIDAGAHEQ